MSARTAEQALANAAARMVDQTDVADSLANLLDDCLGVLSAQAAGVLVQLPDGTLDLLSATSHQAAELELYQLQHDRGPSIDTVTSNRPVTAGGTDDLVQLWHPIGRAIADAGFRAVQAFPLRWHNHTVGALNLFFVRADADTAASRQTAEAFANIATLILAQPLDSDLEVIRARLQQALEGRIVIEQAKGILAYLHQTDMAEAYTLLVARAVAEQLPLTDAARKLVRTTSRRT